MVWLFANQPWEVASGKLMSDNNNEIQSNDPNRPNFKSERNADGSFKKGHSGNPKGRKKGSINLSSRVRRVLEQNAGNDKKVADVLADVLVKEALKNPVKCWNFIKDFMDRDEGLASRDQDGNTLNPRENAMAIQEALDAMRTNVPKKPS